VNLYIDSSVLLRIVLGEPRSLSEWKKATRLFSSELIRVECLRTLDRMQLRSSLPDEEFAARRADVIRQIGAFNLVRLDSAVLERAAEPFPTSIATLDALHLASAVAARTVCADLWIATHDDELATAARAEGFTVIGQDRTRSKRARRA
jgi:predicted nucleic acid-binding protein